ncbi:MAG: uroporphyrinogen decarboxylase family protein [Clostridiaceae bacterium]
MTKRERVIKAITHKTTDFVPYSIFFTQQEYKNVANYLGDKDFQDKIGNHISLVDCKPPQVEFLHGSGYWKDEFGVVWNKNGADKDIGVIDNILIPEPDINGYQMPDVDEDYLRSQMEKVVKDSGDTFRLPCIGFSMFERAWTLTGMENLLINMLIEPEFVENLLDSILEHNLKVIDIALEYDIDGFHFGDDWGQQKGLIMGPDCWRRFIKPRVAKMYERVKNKGKFVSQHSCGDISEILPDLIDMGLDVYQTFQPEIYDIGKVKKEYGSNLTFWGGISTQRLLPFAAPEEIKSVTREIIKILGKDGGYIAAPTHSVPGDVPPENIVALIDAFQHQ